VLRPSMRAKLWLSVPTKGTQHFPDQGPDPWHI
jgi:hypothetical protein